MKTSLKMIALLIVLFSSCGKDGDIGPQGPKGDKGDKGDTETQGPAGQDGQNGQDGQPGVPGAPAGVWSYIYTKQQLTASTPGVYDPIEKVNIFRGYKTYLPDNYRRVANSGLVLVYFRYMDGAWKLGEFNTSYYSEENNQTSLINFLPESRNDYLGLTGTIRTPNENGDLLKSVIFDMKVILVEPAVVTTSALRKGAVNYKDIHAVEKYFGIGNK